MREYLDKKHDQREEKCRFSINLYSYQNFELRIEIRGPKLLTTSNFGLIHRKTKKLQKLSTLLVAMACQNNDEVITLK